MVMVDAFLGYLSAFIVVSATIYSAHYAESRRRVRVVFKNKSARNKTASCFIGLNVSSVPLLLEEIRARELAHLLNEVSLEIANVSRSIENSILRRDLSADGLERLIIRHSRLEERFELLAGGDTCVAETPRLPEPVIVVESPLRPIKALPAPKTIFARRVLEFVKVRPRRTNPSQGLGFLHYDPKPMTEEQVVLSTTPF